MCVFESKRERDRERRERNGEKVEEGERETKKRDESSDGEVRFFLFKCLWTERREGKWEREREKKKKKKGESENSWEEVVCKFIFTFSSLHLWFLLSFSPLALLFSLSQILFCPLFSCLIYCLWLNRMYILMNIFFSAKNDQTEKETEEEREKERGKKREERWWFDSLSSFFPSLERAVAWGKFFSLNFFHSLSFSSFFFPKNPQYRTGFHLVPFEVKSIFVQEERKEGKERKRGMILKQVHFFLSTILHSPLFHFDFSFFFPSSSLLWTLSLSLSMILSLFSLSLPLFSFAFYDSFFFRENFFPLLVLSHFFPFFGSSSHSL